MTQCVVLSRALRMWPITRGKSMLCNAFVELCVVCIASAINKGFDLVFYSVLERKISTRQTREELIKKGVLIIDQGLPDHSFTCCSFHYCNVSKVQCSALLSLYNTEHCPSHFKVQLSNMNTVSCGHLNCVWTCFLASQFHC